MARRTDIPGFDLTDPATYAYWREDPLRFADLDPNQHVNNIALATLIEAIRVDYLHWLLTGIRPEDWAFMIGHVGIDYRAQVFYPSVVRAGTRLLELGEKTATLGTGLFVKDACVATALSISVSIDRATQRATPLPEIIRARFQREVDGDFEPQPDTPPTLTRET
jgi:acyl-CoA thioester hydrolase